MDTRFSPGFFKPSNKLAFSFVSYFSLSVAFQMLSGIAPEGEDLCGGNLKCKQGYITDSFANNNSTNGSDYTDLTYQFNRALSSAKSATDGTLWQLDNCITLNNVGNALITALTKNNSNRTLSSCITTSEWNHAQAASSVTGLYKSNLSEAACDAYKLGFASIVAACSNSAKSASYDLAIAAAIIGSIVVFALSIWGVSKLCECAKNYTCSCRSKEKDEATTPTGP